MKTRMLSVLEAAVGVTGDLGMHKETDKAKQTAQSPSQPQELPELRERGILQVQELGSPGAEGAGILQDRRSWDPYGTGAGIPWSRSWDPPGQEELGSPRNRIWDPPGTACPGHSTGEATPGLGSWAIPCLAKVPWKLRRVQVLFSPAEIS